MVFESHRTTTTASVVYAAMDLATWMMAAKPDIVVDFLFSWMRIQAGIIHFSVSTFCAIGCGIME